MPRRISAGGKVVVIPDNATPEDINEILDAATQGAGSSKSGTGDWESPWSKAARGFKQQTLYNLSPSTLVGGAAQLLQHPIDSTFTPGMKARREKAGQDFQNHNYFSAVSHALQGSVPFLGPATQEFEEANDANDLEAMGRAASDVLAVKYVPKALGIAGDTVGKVGSKIPLNSGALRTGATVAKEAIKGGAKSARDVAWPTTAATVTGEALGGKTGAAVGGAMVQVPAITYGAVKGGLQAYREIQKNRPPKPIAPEIIKAQELARQRKQAGFEPTPSSQPGNPDPIEVVARQDALQKAKNTAKNQQDQKRSELKTKTDAQKAEIERRNQIRIQRQTTNQAAIQSAMEKDKTPAEQLLSPPTKNSSNTTTTVVEPREHYREEIHQTDTNNKVNNITDYFVSNIPKTITPEELPQFKENLAREIETMSAQDWNAHQRDAHEFGRKKGNPIPKSYGNMTPEAYEKARKMGKKTTQEMVADRIRNSQ